MIYACAFLAALLIADTGMTLWAVKHGYYEKNPLMVWIVAHPAAAMLFKAGQLAASLWIILYFWKHGAGLAAWIAFGLFTALAVYPVWANLKTLGRRWK